jgi:LPS-assembly protein
MRLRILGLLLLILLPMNLFAQEVTTPPSPTPSPLPTPTPTPEVAPPSLATPNPQPGKESEFGPLLSFQGGPKGAAIPIEINSDETRFEGGIAIAQGNVVVRYGDATIYADYAEYNPQTHEVVLRGNVRLYREKYAFIADRAIYNLQTKKLTMSDFGGPKAPFQVVGDTVLSENENQYTVLNGLLTTSDSSKPDFQLRARKMRIYADDRIILSNVTLFVGRTPVFWFPYIYQSLNNQFSYNLAPGYNSTWGAYLLTALQFPLATDIIGEVHFDLRSSRGPGGGFDVNYNLHRDLEVSGRLQIYGIYDQSPNINDTALDRVPIGSDRYRVEYQSRTYITSDILAISSFNLLSDQYFLQDFYPNIFSVDPQPDTYTEVTKSGEAYTLSVMARPQINNFLETAERLPELSWDVARTPLFNGPIFYESTNSAAYLHRIFAAQTGNLSVDLQNAALNPNYEFFRLDSFHQLSFPHLYFGWLSLVPSVGVRGTYYSKTGNFTESDVSNPLPEGILVEHPGAFRVAVNSDVEASFKLSKAFESVQQRWLGLDGLRHIVQPYADFSWVSQPNVPSSNILPIDQYIPSTKLQPLDFPEYRSIDSLDRWTILRLGVRNRLQTRRDSATLNWLDVDSFFDVDFDNPLAQVVPPASTSVSRTSIIAPPKELFSNVFNRIRFQPVPWAYLSIDSQVPLLDKGFWSVTTAADWTITPNIEVRLGHQYLQSNPYYQDTSELSLYTYMRLNDNWGFSIYEDYEFKTGLFNRQTYTIHRDLSSWVAALGLNLQNNGAGKNEIAVVLSFTLKDLPRFGLPVNLDVGNAIGE